MNTASVEQQIAKFQLYVSDEVNWPAKSGTLTDTIGHYLKSLNPNLIALMYFHANIHGASGWSMGAWQIPAPSFNVTGGQLYTIHPSWHLTYAGSSLAASASASQTTLSVADGSRFHSGDRALVGTNEIVIVTAVSGTTLTVQRGYFDQNGTYPGAAHSSGEWVRPIAHTFGDQDVLALNVLSSCPQADGGFGPQTWNQFAASFMSRRMSDPLYSGAQAIDGWFLDNFVDFASFVDSASLVDAGNQNTPSGLSDAAWSAGMEALAQMARATLGNSLVIMGNTGGSPNRYGRYLNAGMLEGVDGTGNNGIEGNLAGTTSFYNSWITNGTHNQTFIYEGSPKASSLSAAQSSYQALRFTLTLALVNDGFFAFDEYNVNGGHQTAWWYDEYDNAGQGTGYLGQASGVATQPIGGVYRRDFANGIALANTTGSTQTVNLGGTFRKIKGTQAPSVNDGSQVTSVMLPVNDGIILLRTTSGTVTPTPPPALSATPTTALSTTPTIAATRTPTPAPTIAATATLAPTTTPTAHFSTTGPGAPLLSGAQCAALVRRSSFEPRPQNATANATTGAAAGYTGGAVLDGMSSAWQTAQTPRIDGNFTGTTDEVIQWGACKWGRDEDVVRATAVQESSWVQSQQGDCNPACESFGILQVRYTYHTGTNPYSQYSTAFGVDYALAWWRGVYEGQSWLGTAPRGDDLGAGGVWYDGAYRDGPAVQYINTVQGYVQSKPWLAPGF